MTMVNQFQKDTLDTLGILYKNFLIQKKPKIEVFFGDFRSTGIHPETFFDTVHTLKQHGFSIDEYDRDWTLTKEQEVGARNTPCCEVTLPKDFEAFYQTTIKTAGMSGTKRLIEKDSNGDFSYNSKFVQLSKDTLPYKILDALYENSDQDGYLSYEDIEKILVKSGEAESVSDSERDKRILNAVSDTQGLFRYARVNNKALENKTPKGGVLIDKRRGKGLILNNQTV